MVVSTRRSLDERIVNRLRLLIHNLIITLNEEPVRSNLTFKSLGPRLLRPCKIMELLRRQLLDKLPVISFAVLPIPFLKLFRGHCLNGIVVERQQLLAIELGRRFDDSIEIKLLDQELAIKLLNVIAGIPPQ